MNIILAQSVQAVCFSTGAITGKIEIPGCQEENYDRILAERDAQEKARLFCSNSFSANRVNDIIVTEECINNVAVTTVTATYRCCGDW